MQTKTIFNNLYTSKYFEKLPDFKEQKIQAFITIVLTLIAISFFGIFAISPTLSTIGNLQKQLKDNTFVEKKLDQKLINLQSLSENYQAIEPDLPFVYSAIPKTPEVPSFLGQLAALGSENDIIITRLQTYEVDLTKTQEGIQRFSTFGFTIEAEGSYDNIFSYVEMLSNFQRIILIDAISLSKGSAKNKNLKLSLKGKAFFKK